uniref:Mating-type protein ALPHA1 n=1 Tax=Ogataea thermomethanolica (nom. inval.) TaxID=310468 RepID=A0A5P8D128_9ASCO|nr:silenced mating-type protein ALPHA1 [Ogataea thermomethanolica (nom. inval.)]QGW56840.1 mating-type protein ALPHA1 [Ogataea thermomethanolica (nom. inval.)]
MTKPVGTEILILSDLPEIPVASHFLTKALATFAIPNSLKTRSTPKVAKQALKKHLSKKKRLNGFLAFRSFYSHNVLGYHNQKVLSRVLAQAWGKEPHQIIWSRYALEYNHSNTKLSFHEWLCDQIGQKERYFSRSQSTWCQMNVMSDIVVEDIFQNSLR